MKRLVLLAALTSGAFVACSQADDEPTKVSKNEIINGSPSLTNVGTNAVELHWPCPPNSPGCPFRGNGIMLTDRWLLTAMHVTSEIFDPLNPNDPNDDIMQPIINPGDIAVFFGDSSAFLGVADLIIDHPRWRRRNSWIFAPFSVDMALVRLKDPVPELAAFVRPLYGGPASDYLNFVTNPIVCSGFGPFATDGSGTGTLRFTFPQPTSVFGNGDFFTTEEDPILHHHFWQGDSGTVCIHVPTQSVAGILSSVVQTAATAGTLFDDNGNSYFLPQNGAVLVASEAFRNFVTATLGADAPPIKFDTNRQGSLDDVFFYGEDSVYTAAVIFGEDDIQDFTVSVDLSFFGVTAPIVSTAGGEFGNGLGFDLAAVIDGVLVSVSGTEITALGGGGFFGFSFAPQIGFSPLSSDYVSVRRIDFDGDEFDDLQAVREDGTSDIYIGGDFGLEPADAVFGMPTADEGDGKFMIVSGLGFGTYDAPEQSIFIDVPASETSFSLDVFDGDSGDFSDLGSGNTCYRLWATPAKDQEPTTDTPIVELTSSQMADNAWTNVWSGGIHEDALGGDFYSYRLDVYLADDCDGDPNREIGAQNRYKLRSTGQLSIEYGTIGYIGVDAFGSSARVQPDAPSPDFDYDGRWRWVFDVPDGSEFIVLTDIDADDLDNPPAGAEGANFAIGYTLEDELNALLFETVVSGDYAIDRDTSSTHEAQSDVLLSGLHFWDWFDVWAENAVHMHPQGPGVQFAVTGAGLLPRVAAFNADLPDEWEDRFETNPDEFSPLVLGARSPLGSPGRSLVPDAAAARAILAQAGGSDFAALRGQLLAAELNARRPLAGRTELKSALLYGANSGVREVMNTAAFAVGRGAGAIGGIELTLLLSQLRAINQGYVTFAGRRNVLPASFPGDDDGDAITNGIDNCRNVSNTDQADWNHDGVGSACEPRPVLKCVMEIDEGSRHHDRCRPKHRHGRGFLAFFGYEHDGPELHISRGPTNALSGGEGVPVTRFSPGEDPVAFVARSDGSDIVWRLGQLSATASRSSPRCSGFELTELEHAANAVLYADGKLDFGEHATIADDADIVNAGHGSIDIDRSARVRDVFSANDVSLGLRSRSGVVWANDRVRRSRDAEAEGIVQHAGLDFDPLNWSMTFPHGHRAPVRVRHGAEQSLAPGAYGDVSVQRDGTLRLRAGTYHFDSLSVEHHGELAVDTSGGAVVVYVRDSLEIDATPTGSLGASNFFIGYFGHRDATISAELRAMVVAAKAKLVLGNGRPQVFTGRFFAEDIVVRSRATLSLN